VVLVFGSVLGVLVGLSEVVEVCEVQIRPLLVRGEDRLVVLVLRGFLLPFLVRLVRVGTVLQELALLDALALVMVRLGFLLVALYRLSLRRLLVLLLR
jgi:hypothetical protein